jgi:transposase
MDKTKIRRVFSESFKRAKVAEIDSGKVKISEIARTYNVTTGAIRKWIRKYSFSYQPTIKMVVEMESETLKTQQLTKKIADLERIIGQKQLEIDFLNTLVKVSSEELGTDLRKVFFIKHSTDSVP